VTTAPPATDPLAVALLALVVAVAVIVALFRDVLAAVVVFAAYSLGLAVLWVVYRAPDVALTEAAVGAGVTTSLFLVAIRRMVRPTGERALSLRVRPRSVVAAGLVGGLLLWTVPALPAVGDPTAPAFGPVPEFYLTDAPERGVTNVVTAVLVVYRGFDTFGEVVVVFAAAVAVLVATRREVL
jgi:multicomponent Na+:H+ antiporter subunit B